MLRFLLSILTWACLIYHGLAGLILHEETHSILSNHQYLTHNAGRSTLASRATSGDIDKARKIVKDAIAQMSALNKARLDKPARNHYSLKPGTRVQKRSPDESPPPLLNVTKEIARAAALLAELDASANSSFTTPINITAPTRATGTGNFWMEGIARKGTVPWGNDSGYKVFRNVVTDYKADPTGQKDSTASIQQAIDDGKRCGAKCNGSSTKNAIVYLPPGRYLVSSTLKLNFGTQIIGDANNWPQIIASSSFVGMGVLSTDVYVDNGGKGPDGNDLEWYINTARFYSQIRNLRIDITATDPNAYVCAIHYQVAQATTLQNIELIAKTGTTQQGMFSENGSGGVMSDITFTGGNVGFYGGNQQFSASRMTFNGCKTAVQIIWDWGWVWKTVKINNVDVGFKLLNEDGSGHIGSISLMDSTLSNIANAAIIMVAPTDKPGSIATDLILDNVNLGGRIADSSGNQLLGSGYYKNYVFGPTYKDGKRTFQSGKSLEYTREKTLLGDSVSGLQVAPYFERQRNQYTDKGVGDFVHLKDGGAKGDGSSDDTRYIQDLFNKYGDGSKIVFVDSGTYILTDTVTIPKDAKIVGEAWAQFAASGSKFSDPLNPKAMLKVGNDGDVGTIEMQDLILTTKGGTAGAILMEWNVRAKSPGAAALWDVHARVGGATGTGLTPTECPPITTGTNPSFCNAASMLLHITKRASGYFDNMWLWVADHMLDDPDLNDDRNKMDQLSVYSARGVLIESQAATWLYGTASEHNTFYQYNFHNAQNIFTTMIQTESPYYQPTPKPPAPFDKAVGKIIGDPNYDCKGGNFDGCDESWAVIMTGSQNIHIGGAGTYSWFSTYAQDCIDQHTCQKTLWYIDSNYDNNRLQHVVGIGAKTIMVVDGKDISAADNLAVTTHPAWSQISIVDVPSKGKAPSDSPDDKCDPKDKLISPDTMPTGSFMPWDLMRPESALVSTKYYLTIVNLTPYRFVKTSQHFYQFDVFDFGDVPSGKARQNTMVYSTETKANPVDDNGEAYYKLQGTDKTFEIRGTTHIPDNYPMRTVVDLTGMGLGQREYGDPQQESPVTLVITGSESYGYITSLNFGANNWMHQLYDVIRDRQIRHIAMPGSHDAGMGSITSGWGNLGDSADTQTQGLSIYDQLRVGSRWFDMRLVSVCGGDFWAVHVNDEKSANPVGASGEKLDDIIDDVNKFTSESPGEIIIWWVKYMVNMDQYCTGNPRQTRYWDATKANEFYTRLEKINNRCIGLDKSISFERRTAQTFMDKNNGGGCVLILTDGTLNEGIPKDRPASGIYYGQDYMKRDDYWAEKTDTESLASAQVDHMLKNKHDNGNDKLTIMQWQVTPTIDSEIFFGLSGIAIEPTNPALYWYAVNSMSPEYFPTVVLQDYIGYLHLNEGSFPGQLGSEIRVLCMGLNLYMISQNCELSHRKHPLLKQGSNPKTIITQTGYSNETARPIFNGVIYANGTVDSSPAPGFHLGRVEVFKAGTVFSNNTVLVADTPNPDFHAEI